MVVNYLNFVFHIEVKTKCKWTREHYNADKCGHFKFKIKIY